MRLIPILLPGLLAVAACDSKISKKEMPLAETQPAYNIAYTLPATYLEGLYATSNSTMNDIFDLFDTDTEHGWRTLPGTGTGECVTLSFASAQALQAVQLVPEEGILENEETFVQTFVNGTLGEGGNIGDKIPLGSVPVKTLCLCFLKTGLEESASRDKEGTLVQFEVFPPDAFVGIKEFNVFNDKGEPLRLVPPARYFGTASASSTLEPEAANSTANLFDAQPETAWSEGNKDSGGEGETLSFRFEEMVSITAIQIWNGHQRSDDQFFANPRVSSFEFGAKDSATTVYTLEDKQGGQKINLPHTVKGQVFDLKIKNFYPGRKYKDLAISEILFFNGDLPFTMTNQMPQKYKAALQNKLTGSPIFKLLDRRISNRVEKEAVVASQSLVLRSDNTFSFYGTTMQADSSVSQVFADGTWELGLNNEANTLIRVSGKWVVANGIVSPSGTNVVQRSVQMFSDELTTNGDVVQGKRAIGTFYVR